MSMPTVCSNFDVQIRDRYTGKLVKSEPIPETTVPVTAFLKKIRGRSRIESISHQDNLTLQKDNSEDGGTSRLFYAVHQCFAKHLPLALSPEVLLYMVLHEIAVTVKMYPESYRHLFTKDSGKQLIRVRHDGLMLGNTQSPWHEVMPMFEVELGKVVPSSVLQHAVPDFSTHTAITRAASMVAFMDMASPYYDYRVRTRCGIPKIRLLGTPSDYAKLSESCIELAALFGEHLSDYFAHLLPVVNKIAEQAHGFGYDNDFWSSIYKHLSGSGTDDMTGWLTAFLNYTVEGDNTFVPKSAKYYDWKAGMEQTGWASGYHRSAIPSHVSAVPFIWEYLGSEIPMSFLGGILSITNVDGYVTPGLGFAVLNKGE